MTPQVFPHEGVRDCSGALAAFECATPSTKPRHRQAHPQPWEWQAQAVVRRMATRVPRSTRVIRLHTGMGHLAAVGAFTPVVPDHHDRFYVNVVAVANGMQEARLGTQLLDLLLDRMSDLAGEQGVEAFVVQCKIHAENDRSLAMVRRASLLRVEGPDEDKYEVWAGEFLT